MKNYLFLAAMLLCAGCQDTAMVTPKPDIKPVIVSNTQTRNSIKATQKEIGDSRIQIKKAQESEAKGDDKLQSVDDDLKELLGEQ